MKSEKVIELMLAGRKFMYFGSELSYKDNAFKYKTVIKEGIIQSFEYVEEWELITEWYDNIPSCGILCRTWDNHINTTIINIVKRYSNNRFICEKSLWWDNAEPLEYNSEMYVENL